MLVEMIEEVPVVLFCFKKTGLGNFIRSFLFVVFQGAIWSFYDLHFLYLTYVFVLVGSLPFFIRLYNSLLMCADKVCLFLVHCHSCVFFFFGLLSVGYKII